VGLTVTVLGCDGSYPGPGGAGSGYLLRGGGATVWLDCGPGTLAALQTHVGLHDVDAVVVSHEHPDHRNDLEGFHVACAYIVRRDGIPVWAPAGVREHGYHTGPPTLLFSDLLDGSRFAVGGMSFTASRTDHGPETMAIRVEADGRSLGYTADTGPDWSPTRLGPALDLLLSEATFTESCEGHSQHLSGRQAGLLARQAAARRLVLTHVWPITDRDELRAEAEAAYGGPVELAEMGRTYTA
jgi:ribonuclease BN (tRNA processing enzyme)